MKKYQKNREVFFTLENASMYIVDSSSAIEFYSKELKKYPSEKVYFERGIAYYLKNDYVSSLKDFSNAIDLCKLARRNHHRIWRDIHRWRGNTYLQLKKYQSALQDFTVAYISDSSYYESHYKLSKQESKSAIEDFSNFVQLQPNNIFLYHKIAEFHLKNNNFQLAIENYTEAIKRQPYCFETYILRAKACLLKKEYPSAIEDYTQAIVLNPEHSKTYVLRGKLYLIQKDYHSANSDFTKAISLKPDNILGYYERGKLFLDSCDYDSAIQDFSKIVYLRPNFEKISDKDFATTFRYVFPKAYFLRGKEHFNNERYDLAIEDFTNSIVYTSQRQ